MPANMSSPPPAAVVATVSPIYPDAALIAADDAACEQALTNWLRAPGLAADASAQEWRDAWRVAAAAADVALQKTVQVDQERIRVTQEYETFRAGAANLATEQARTWHSQLASAKARVSALETTLARYQAAYPPPPIDDEPTPEGEQTLVPGVRPISQRERIEARMVAPLTPRVPQKPLNVGLFDEDARNQLDLF